MKFVELTEKEYEKYWENHPLKTFLSSPKIAKLREKNNWKSYFVGVKEDKEIIAAAMLLSHKRKFNVNEFYSPRGFLLDFKNEELFCSIKNTVP
jgi:serine/alanine adding enzyme